MATTIVDLLAQAGIAPNTDPNKTTSARAATNFRRRTTPVAPMVPVPQVSQMSAPGGGNIQWDTSHLIGDGPSKGDSSFGSDLWGFIKKGIDIVDTPRAFVVSGVKELTDTIEGSSVGHWLATNDTFGSGQSEEAYQADKKRLGSGSWNDFTKQGWDNIGFRQVVDAVSPTRPGWVKAVSGFAGDIALDPLMHTGSVMARGAGTATEKALQAAVHTGGRNEIAKALSLTVAEKGIEKTPAIEHLIGEAGRRGTGALTRGALDKAGVSLAEREALGINRLRKTAFGVELVGSTRVAELGASFKGEMKKVFGELPGAKTFRSLRVAEAQGERSFIEAMRSKGVSAAVRTQAATALLTVNKTRSLSRGWFDKAARTVKETYSRELHALSPEADVAATHALEAGATDALSTKTRTFFDQIHASLTKLGAKVGYREGYVPHVVTEDFHKLVDSRPELAKWVTGLGTKQSFEKARTLEKGSEFMGHILDTGSIKEINDISVAVTGVKLFEDRLSQIIPSYLVKAKTALELEVQKKALIDYGVAVDAVQVVKKRALTPAEKATLAAAKSSSRAAKVQQSIHLGEGITIRREEAGVARKALMARKRDVWRRVDAIDKAVMDAGRARTAAEARLARLDGRLRHAQGSLDEWSKVAKSERAAEARATRAKIKTLKAEVARLSEQRTAAARAVDIIVSGSGRGRSWQAKGFKDQVDALGLQRDKLLAEHSRLSTQLDNLKAGVASPGEVARISERRVSQETARVARFKITASKAADAADVAASTFSFVAAERATVVDVLNKTEAAIDDAFSRVVDLPESGARLNVRKAAAVEIRDRTAVARQLLERGGDPAFEMMAKLEANAAIFDMKAWRAGNDVLDAEAVVKTLSDPKFREYMVRQADHGFKLVDDTHQLPNWVDNALQVEHRLRDPKFWDGLARGAHKFNNLWKGWATARPGFMTRNMYDGLINIYLEGGAGALHSVGEFTKFWRVYKAHPDTYLQDALKHFDQATIDKMDDALHVVFGTGGGLVPAEVEVGLGRRMNLKPWSTDNVAIRGTRAGSENIEAVLRGGHAYDVMKRGGTADLAMDTVTKWHFNYTDITSFDKAMKNVIPFWTFYSRNLALQAHVWTHMPQKLNATFYNFERNFGNQGGDTFEPGWFTDAAAIQLGKGGAGHDTPYLLPDLPTFKAVDDVKNLLHPFDGALLGNTNPLIKLPFEHMAGKQTFSGVPFKNSYAETVNGSKVGREAPLWAQTPGVFQLLQAAGLANTNASDQKVMTDQAQYMAESAMPFLNDVSRLAPNQPKMQDKAGQNWLSFLGVGLKYNNDVTRKGEQYRRSLAEKAAAKRKKELGL